MSEMSTPAAPGVRPGAGGARFGACQRRWLLVLLALVYTCNFIDRSILSTLAQPIKKDLHFSDAQLGMLGGLAFAVFYTLLGIPLARLVERSSRTLVMSACIAVWSLMTAACGLATSFWQLAAARVGVGIGESGCLPAAQSLIGDYYPPARRARAIGVFLLGIPAGTMTGAVAGGWIAQHLSWRVAFLVVGLPGLLLALLAVLTLKEPPRGHAEGIDASAPAPPLTAVLRRFGERSTAIWVCAGAVAATTPVYAILTFTAAYFNRRFGLDFAQAGLAAGLVSGVGAAVSIMGGGVLADRMAERDRRAYAWVSIAGLVVAVPLYVVAFTRPDWRSALALMVLAAAAQQLYVAPTFAVASNAFEPRMRATSVAIMTFCWTLVGLGFGPVAAGEISDRIGQSLKAGGNDLLGLCQQAGCADFSAVGLQYALIAVSLLDVLAIVLFAVSARRMQRDLA